MNINKAIEILELSVTAGFYGNGNDFRDAKKLGIEALKARKVWQDNEGFDPAEALPGETEE